GVADGSEQHMPLAQNCSSHMRQPRKHMHSWAGTRQLVYHTGVNGTQGYWGPEGMYPYDNMLMRFGDKNQYQSYGTMFVNDTVVDGLHPYLFIVYVVAAAARVAAAVAHAVAAAVTAATVVTAAAAIAAAASVAIAAATVAVANRAAAVANRAAASHAAASAAARAAIIAAHAVNSSVVSRVVAKAVAAKEVARAAVKAAVKAAARVVVKAAGRVVKVATGEKAAVKAKETTAASRITVTRGATRDRASLVPATTSVLHIPHHHRHHPHPRARIHTREFRRLSDRRSSFVRLVQLFQFRHRSLWLRSSGRLLQIVLLQPLRLLTHVLDASLSTTSRAFQSAVPLDTITLSALS
ncbi:hypothetical protein LPJ53_001272, partial [Coemansia erecta]